MPRDEQTLANQVLAFVRTHPGQKAATIAAALAVDRRQVNSLLHGPLRAMVRQDAKYRWLPADGGPQRLIAQEGRQLDTPLARLAGYYLDCLNHENPGGVAVFATGKHGLDYAELPLLPPLLEEPLAALQDEGARRILGRVRRNRQLGAMIGYPVHLAYARARSGWEGYFVEPLFLWPMEADPLNPHGPPTLTEGLPQINFRAVGSLFQGHAAGVAEEAAQLSEELGLGVTPGELPELDELMLRLRDLHPEWPWVEDPDPSALAASPPLKDATSPGLYNRAVVLAAERSPYTRGLEAELRQLQSVPEERYAGTALGNWLAGVHPDAATPDDDPLLEVLPLNSEQREAIRRSLSAPLTVITGPPGTGKSQVVTSLLINAAIRNQRVLFASKNNKAVDVVEARANALGPRPILLRLGAAELQRSLASYLLTLISAVAAPDDQAEYAAAEAAIAPVRRRFDELARELEQTVALRNAVDRLEQEVEALRKELGDERFRKLQPAAVGTGRLGAAALAAAAERADSAKQGLFVRLFWILVRGGRYQALWREAAGAREWADLLGVSLPEAAPTPATFRAWRESVGRLTERTAMAEKVAGYFEKLAELSAAVPPEQISRATAAEIERLAEASARLWDAWLRVQPGRLTPQDRRRLQEYASLLQLIVEGQSAGRRVDRKVYSRYHQLFPEIAHLLPCWAVTSLSARGRVPFEPGFFDLLVIDEASQCDIASALPLLYRAKRAVIIGDPQQLKHISSLHAAQDTQLLAKHGLAENGAGWSYSTTSLFDRASGFASAENLIQLRDHHRSHAHIIEFSNAEYYDGRLRVATRYDRLKLPSRDNAAIRWIDVRGRVQRPRGGGALNDAEARAVVAELERLVVQQRYTGTVGVVTPFRAQANRIRELVHANENLSVRLDSTEFIADTAHRFQGDERDVILLSLVVGPGMHSGGYGFLNSTANLFTPDPAHSG